MRNPLKKTLASLVLAGSALFPSISLANEHHSADYEVEILDVTQKRPTKTKMQRQEVYFSGENKQGIKTVNIEGDYLPAGDDSSLQDSKIFRINVDAGRDPQDKKKGDIRIEYVVFDRNAQSNMSHERVPANTVFYREVPEKTFMYLVLPRESTLEGTLQEASIFDHEKRTLGQEKCIPYGEVQAPKMIKSINETLNPIKRINELQRAKDSGIPLSEAQKSEYQKLLDDLTDFFPGEVNNSLDLGIKKLEGILKREERLRVLMQENPDSHLFLLELHKVASDNLGRTTMGRKLRFAYTLKADASNIPVKLIMDTLVFKSNRLDEEREARLKNLTYSFRINPSPEEKDTLHK